MADYDGIVSFCEEYVSVCLKEKIMKKFFEEFCNTSTYYYVRRSTGDIHVPNRNHVYFQEREVNPEDLYKIITDGELKICDDNLTRMYSIWMSVKDFIYDDYKQYIMYLLKDHKILEKTDNLHIRDIDIVKTFYGKDRKYYGISLKGSKYRFFLPKGECSDPNDYYVHIVNDTVKFLEIC